MTTIAPETGVVLEWHDPATLLVDTNIREAKPDKELIDSVKAIGVQQPLIAIRTDEGVMVRMGARRRLAAIEAGCQVPVMVHPAGSSGDEIARIFAQWAENEYRSGLTAAEKADVVQTLFDLGLDAKKIKRQTSLTEAEIAAAQVVAASKEAAKVAAKHPAMTLDQLAAIDEFSGDRDAVLELTKKAGEGDGPFMHELQRRRDARERAQRVQAKIDELKKAKVKIASQRQPAHYDNNVSFYADAEGKQFTEESHRSCPGHVVTVSESFYGKEAVQIAGYCTDPKKYGHKRFRHGGGEKKPMSDAEKAERRTVITNNKAWRSAEQVRRKWLRDFCSRQTPPSDALWWAMNEIAYGETRLTSAIGEGHQYARILLGLPHHESRYGTKPTSDLRDMIEKAKPPRRTMILLTLVLGAYEGHTSTSTWRGSWGNGWDVRYFKALAAWGYPLSDVEQIPIKNAEENERKRAEAIAEVEALRAEHDEPCTTLRLGRTYEHCAGCGWTRDEHLARDLARAEADEADEGRKLAEGPGDVADADIDEADDELDPDPLDDDPLNDGQYED